MCVQGAEAEAPPMPLSFSKATFSAEGSDQALDMNDPSFWEKVLGAKPAQRLLSDLTEGKLEAGSEEYITRFIGGLLGGFFAANDVLCSIH